MNHEKAAGFPRWRLRNGLPLEDACAQAVAGRPTEIVSLGEGSNGCAAYRLRVADQWLKCYECASAERAQMVRSATAALQQAEVPIPQVLRIIDHVVFAEWVDGKPFAEGKGRPPLARIVQYQARIHAADISGRALPIDGLVHLEWLMGRVKSATRGQIARARIESLCDMVRDAAPAGLSASVLHADFIKTNLVKIPCGEMVIVDNEFLSMGLGRELDILNAARVYSGGDEHLCQIYLDAYAAAGDVGSLHECREFWEMCFLTKLVGKCFLHGKFEEGRRHLESLERNVGIVT